ncbi:MULTISPECIES: GNAT family N-acetyltransferase [unclassified Fusibacter]|uniref:GNAT family N-acetyltransferase n=1 Tax=unclassified Fusibacter TaxID=2624464 RepID=UPI001013515F|nr:MULTISPECIES: GNAT family protein [unclassified Fusibacter]MCK8059598.1 GNAT family N-acetyltransferase [Fusibacter sp. A2]NPE21399.1 GNAT family N-acetyltransferase [Fusibacter sp. A1]RXV61814.1 N-acetyltransferase [Fusibacter sp. A1]
MLKLISKRIYLATLEKEDCVKLWNDFEYDFDQLTEPLNIGHSSVKADTWFEETQKDQGDKHVRLGIFLLKGEVIGDVALQNIDWKNRSCSIGLGISTINDRSKGYGTEALQQILEYGFNNLGLEKITASTLESNIGAQKSLLRCGFKKEGTERSAVYFAGKRFDRMHFGILRAEFNG